MSEVREPLPYPHARGPFDHGAPAACTLSESPYEMAFTATQDCPGCRVYAMGVAMNEPHLSVTMTEDGTWVTLIERIREITDELDPRRVLFERALADRGIA